jgi:hypothetical protein
MNTLQDRIVKSEQDFNQQKQRRDQLLQEADLCLVEMNKLQGEYRVLQELLEAENTKPDTPKKVSSKANTVTATPESESK